MRDFGEVEFVRTVLPEWILPVMEAITRLGDLWMLLAVATLAYLYVGGRRGGYALGTVLGGLALLAGLKAVFALPRPPTELHYVATGTTGFPSGHAMGATVVYGTLAMTLDELGTETARFAAAGALVVAIAFSRVALGVHYAVDVVAGIVVGLAYLGFASRTVDGNPLRAFGAATLFAVAGLVAGTATGATPYAHCVRALCFDPDTVVAVGATSGGLLGWLVAGSTSAPPGSVRDRLAADPAFAASGAGVAIVSVGLVVGLAVLPVLVVPAVLAGAGVAGVLVARVALVRYAPSTPERFDRH